MIHPPMTAEEFRELIKNHPKLGVAGWLGVSRTSVSRWARGHPVPYYAAMMLRLRKQGVFEKKPFLMRAIKRAYNDPKRIDQLLSL